ncbi:MAG: alkaline phosphatase family protein [Myxococcota bacterium]
MSAARTSAVLLALSLALPQLSSADPSQKKLAVLVVIDQLGSEYLARYGALLDGGLGTMMRRGAFYQNGVHDQANTATGPGHATISTGAWPDVNGIVSNEWFDPKDGARIYCVQDAELGASPRLLMVPTIGDQLRAITSNQSRVVSLSIKDRVAILLGGQDPSIAAWYDSKVGAFVSGRYVKGTPPRWLEAINAENNAEAGRGKVWDRLRNDVDYIGMAGKDDVPWEAQMPGLGRTFPRTVGQDIPDELWRDFYRGTPQLLGALMKAAKAGIEAEKLGRGPAPDLLLLGVSTLDFVGHYYGPTSQEALDVLLRIDRELGELMRFVDQKLGQGQTLWVLTGDHGVALAPEAASEFGLRAARIGGTPLQTLASAALAPLVPKGKPPVMVTLVDAPLLYLSPTEPGIDRTALRRAVAAAIRQSPTIVEAWAWEDVDRFHPPWREMYRRVLYPGREPDVLFRQRPGDVLDEHYGTGTNHGSPYAYDTHVPIMFYGPGVHPGREVAAVPVTAIAPTLAAWFGIPPPAAALERPLSLVSP